MPALRRPLRRPTGRSPRWCPAIAVAVVCGSLLAACGSGSSGRAAPTGNWTLATYTNRSGTITAPSPAATISFSSDGQLNGTTGCNTFGGRWSTSGSELRFSAVGMTAKACTDPAVNDQETAVGIAFSKPESYSVRGEELTIGATDGSTSLTFTRAD